MNLEQIAVLLSTSLNKQITANMIREVAPVYLQNYITDTTAKEFEDCHLSGNHIIYFGEVFVHTGDSGTVYARLTNTTDLVYVGTNNQQYGTNFLMFTNFYKVGASSWMRYRFNGWRITLSMKKTYTQGIYAPLPVS